MTTVAHVVAAGVHNGVEIMQALVAEGRMNVNIIDGYARTSAHIAAQNNQFDLLQILPSLGGDLNIKDIEGRAPIHYASHFGHIESVKTLLAMGVSIDVKDNAGNLPLYYARGSGHLELVKLLLLESSKQLNGGGAKKDKEKGIDDQNRHIQLLQHQFRSSITFQGGSYVLNNTLSASDGNLHISGTRERSKTTVMMPASTPSTPQRISFKFKRAISQDAAIGHSPAQPQNSASYNSSGGVGGGGSTSGSGNNGYQLNQDSLRILERAQEPPSPFRPTSSGSAVTSTNNESNHLKARTTSVSIFERLNTLSSDADTEHRPVMKQ